MARWTHAKKQICSLANSDADLALRQLKAAFAQAQIWTTGSDAIWTDFWAYGDRALIEEIEIFVEDKIL